MGFTNHKRGWGKLLKVCISKFSIWQVTLPYNLNWLQSFSWLSEFLEQNPIVVVDIGARGGSLEELEPFRSYVRYIGFDADSSEVTKLKNAGNMGFKFFEVHPYFIGKEDGVQSFHLYRNLGESSQLLPNPQYQKSFAPDFVIDKSITVDGTTLNTFFKGKDIDVDVLKLDTQGTEFDILENGREAIRKALLIECEVEFTQMYLQQKLFHDVADLLRKEGFTILYLNRVFVTRKRFKGISRGQIIFGDALFGLNEDGVAKLSWQKKKKYCALLINYGLADYAYDIFMNDPDLQRVSPEMARYFATRTDEDALFRKVKRVLWMQVEKVMAFLLLARKTNQLPSDSDRSWPIR